MQLLQEFKKIETADYRNTLIVVGPKGSGKTSALRLLALQLRKENKVYYIDLGMLTAAKQFLQELGEFLSAERPTLLIDKVQLIEKIHGEFPLHEYVYPNIIAACSPGYNDKSLSPFRKERGDGMVQTVYFRPLCFDDALALLKCLFPEITVKESDSGPQAQAQLPVTTFTKEEFTQLLYVTGGVPRYLVEYCRTGNHDLMEEELSHQLSNIVSALSKERLCKLVIRTETMRLTPPTPLTHYGIAYVDQKNQVNIASPKYLDYVLHHNDLVIETEHDWKELERLAAFNIGFRKCEVVNYNNTTIVLPIPMKFIVQKDIEELAHDDIQAGSVTLIELVPGHPVVDLLLVDMRAKDTLVYFVRTSFSQYNKHEKKREDLATTNLTQARDSKTVEYHYKECLRYNKEYFIYATPEFEHKCQDEEVYFLDLRRQVFH